MICRLNVRLRRTLLICLISWWAVAATPTVTAAPIVRVMLPPGVSPSPLSGRLWVMFAPVDTAPQQDVYLELTPTADAIAFFGQDITDWRPGRAVTLSPTAAGFPYAALSDLPVGRYRLQVSFERYESYQRKDGHTLRLRVIEPLDADSARVALPRRWYSVAEEILWDGRQSPRPLTLSIPIAPHAVFKDTPWVKSFRIRSERLSAFWGRDIYLGALVTLPAGYAEHPSTRYPVLIRLGGLPLKPSHWREHAPDDSLSPESTEARAQQVGFDNFKYWQAPTTPRMVMVELQHPTPYADTSLAVNSLNNGPYAEAIRLELLPALEQAFRIEPAAWGRFLLGASAGGWSALALQLHYPEDFNGVWAACPDPVDFRHLGLIDLQNDTNAFFDQGPHLRLSRAAQRDAQGRTLASVADVARWEQALAERSRSGELWDQWEAAFSPVGIDGYPSRIWHRETGVIDDDTAEHWHQHHDLQGLLRRLSPDKLAHLRGKLRIRIGDRDAYFFDNAVRALESSLRQWAPDLGVSVDYGRGIAECWGGRHDVPVAIGRTRYLQDVLPWALERALQTAPSAADLAPWRY